ncbi:MAG TPA: DUF3891 family protein [Flavisolibacter sp.]|nr:DUF3891 family protein [Flavisolibacter sp.]
MIVNYKQEGWEVITQRAHGIVAAQLAAQWKAAHRPQRWLETILAIAEHDDAENELDGEILITDAGGPLNFAMKNFDLEKCRKLASLTITKSRYIALLSSMHMTFLYEKDGASDPKAKAFLKEQAALQSQWRSELSLSKEESLRIYDLMEWCDALSLLICKGDMQPEERRLEISTGPDKKKYFLVQTGEDVLAIDPWPFEGKEFSVNFEYRTLSQVQFRSSADFRALFITSTPSEKKWRLAPLPKAKEQKKASKI